MKTDRPVLSVGRAARLGSFCLFCVLVALCFGACGGGSGNLRQSEGAKDSTLVVAILGDADYLNPVIGSTVTSNNIFGLIYPALLQSEFDTTTGLLNFLAAEKSFRASSGNRRAEGALARRWIMSPDNRSLTYILRNDVFWDDGKPVVSRDFKFTYRLYGNPVIASPRQQYLSELIGADKGLPDIDRAIETPDDTTLIFRFYKPVPEHLALFHTGLVPLPEHVWKHVKPEDFRSSPLNHQPVSAGPYRLKSWAKQQEVVLASNRTATLPKPGNIPLINWRIVPDYTVRLAQLQTGTVDIVENVKPEDLAALSSKKGAGIEVKSVGLRVYDYVGWSNIDQGIYHRTGRFVPHPLFGSAEVRKALTMAIDREAIIDGYLKEYGTVCNTDISPSLKWAYHSAITPHPFDQAKARDLLKKEGWLPGSDGILQKNGRKFSFVLYTNAGNARRNYASVIIQQNLRAIGIDCRLDFQESNVFFENLRNRRLDAWLAGWSIGLEIDPIDSWGSDLKKSTFNFTGYRNPRVDELCELAKGKLVQTDARPYWLEYQEILHRDQPVTFLYWIRETHGFSKRINGELLTILSTFYNIDDWRLTPSKNLAP